MSGRSAAAVLICSAMATAALGAVPGTPGPTVTARKPTPKPAATAARPALDFSGTWDLDVRASLNVFPTLESGLTLVVRQTGNRIWLEPSGEGARRASSSEMLVADGRPYKKPLGPGGTGSVTAKWSPDGQALLIEVTAGDSVQRTRWTMSRDRKTWWRHTITKEAGSQRETGMVFRKRASGAKTAKPPARTPTTAAAPTPSPN